MSALSEAAEWHEEKVRKLRVARDTLLQMGVPNYGAGEIAQHKYFATAIREADSDEPKKPKK